MNNNLPTTPDNLPVPTKPPAAELAIVEAKPEAPILTSEQARELTEQAKVGLGRISEVIDALREGQAWRVLYYESWEAYVSTEFRQLRAVANDPVYRADLVASLREGGMTYRGIGTVLGVSRNTALRADLEVGQNAPPQDRPATIGKDGKSYKPRPKKKKEPELLTTEETPGANLALAGPPSPPPAPPGPPKEKRPPLTNTYREALHRLEMEAEKIRKLHADNRFKSNRLAMAEGHADTLGLVIKRLSSYFDQLIEGIGGKSVRDIDLLANSTEVARVAEEAARLLRDGALDGAPAEVRADIVATYRRAGELLISAAKFGGAAE